MPNAVSFLAYEELIRKGWFISQYTELARDLEVLERYGHLEREQRRRLLKLAQEVQGSDHADGSAHGGPAQLATQPSPTKPIH